MTSTSTTIRVSVDQRERLRRLANNRNSSLTETLDAALEALKRQQFYEQMAQAEADLREEGDSWDDFVRERDAWLEAGLGSA